MADLNSKLHEIYLIFQKEDLLNRLKEEEPELNIKEIEFR